MCFDIFFFTFFPLLLGRVPQILACAKGVEPSGLLKLAQVQTKLKASLEEMVALVDDVLHPEAYSREEICKALGISSEQFSAELLSANTQHREQCRGYGSRVFCLIVFCVIAITVFFP